MTQEEVLHLFREKVVLLLLLEMVEVWMTLVPLYADLNRD